MANYPSNYQRKKTQYWTEGSTARALPVEAPIIPDEEKTSTAPKPKPQKRVPNAAPKKQTIEKQKKQTRPFVEEKPYAKPRMDANIGFFSMCFLIAAILVTLYTCFQYLRVQAETIVITKEVRQLENKLSSLQERNEEAANLVASSVHLDEVYRVAVNDLGMVFPNQNTTIVYQGKDLGYVRQYKDIPKEETLEKIKQLLRQTR